MAVALGNLGGPVLATVDADGRVRLAGATWALDWFVRGDDGWHRPSATRSRLSQRRVDGTPVVETAIRIGRGEIVHRAFVGRTAAGVDAVVVELENHGAAPIGVALAVAGGSRIDLDDRRLLVDGRIALSLPRPPARTAGSLAEILEDGGTPNWPGPIRARRGRAEAAIVFPLAHTARLRVVAGADVAPGEVPAAENVVAGWSAHLGAGVRLDLPDDRMATARRADLADLLLREPLDAATDVDAVLALDRFGHHDPAGRAVRRAVDEQRLHRGNGAPLLALLEHWRLTGAGDPEAAAGVVAAAAHRARRTGGPAVQLAAADLLDAAGQPEAAALCRERAAAVERSGPSADVGATTPARRLLTLRDVLIGDMADGLTIVPAWPDEWLGQGVEVHGAPTRWGRLGFAVRWHGSRPALLWEHDGGDGVVVRTGLDPAWSTTAAQGEALLAPVEPAGGLPKVVTPLAEPGTPVDEAAPDGEGFT